ncbi:MAG: hypothetical protein JKX80_01020 [Candidatus Pacebacteria bacterium]|nr:hypothetical protein [Candidatus Paceibacterota bacterium]
MKFPNSTDIKNDLKKNAYTNIPLSIPEGAIQNAVDAFMTFAKSPEHVKENYKLPTKKGANKCDEVGYKHYGTYNNKPSDIGWFQYNRKLLPELTAQHRSHTEKEMVEKMGIVYEHACVMFSKLVDSLEKEFPGLRKKLYDEDSDIPRFSMLRFLRYGTKGAEPDKYLGFTPHYDSGSCTISLAESGPGLLLGHERRSVAPPVREEGHALMFCGLYFYKLTSDDFAPSLHLVDPHANKGVDDDVARWAVIFFVDHDEFKKCDVCEKIHW